ncbi:hypothetical protein BJ875DRAFT_74714 [Amylocarpus encephaloides]|uniref:C2H2-type domain-containing protein n=1 Tax=Amylocarpus encephaloides TaxID=45428 RepID=A0A9P7YET8_9HELO|nr:hypothetical protein BJ875DRAFT_74714 [Amylocarpus encephaloides]
MASSKEIQHSSRPLGQHRLSMSTNSGSLPKSHSRNHSHSVSGSLIPSHRVTRRKSVSSNASNVAAMVAAVREAGETSLGVPISHRRNTMSKSTPRSVALGCLPSPPASLPSHRIRMTSGANLDGGESAIDDEQNDDIEEDEETEFKQSRMRRASEGQHTMKDGKKASGGDLKCDKCGKGYKHSSCLTKHLWEHTPEWSYTSKLLISKHQQVQLLEAASVLLAMNQDGTTPPDSAKDFQSDHDSASPTASSSEPNDRASSADTTPPPHVDISNAYSSGSYTGRTHKRYSSGYGYSRSYQSAPSANPLNSGSVPLGSGFGHYRQPSHEPRPPSSGLNRNAEDDGLAAAVELLSCSFGSTGTPRTVIPVTLPEDAPPVPHIPAQYLNQGAFPGTSLTPSQYPRQPESYTRGQNHLDEDVKMEESEDSAADDEEYDRRSRGRSDEDDDGVFGRMEE